MTWLFGALFASDVPLLPLFPLPFLPGKFCPVPNGREQMYPFGKSPRYILSIKLLARSFSNPPFAWGSSEHLPDGQSPSACL